MSILSTTAFAQEAADDNTAARLAGSNRYETAIAISKEGWETSDYVVLARGDSFADALTAGPLAGKFDAPILLTTTGSLSEGVLGEIQRLEAKHIYLIGGESAISSKIEKELKDLKVGEESVTVERISGKDRYETSVLIAEEIGASAQIALATGDNYPDALSIAPIAAAKDMPILLTQKAALPKSVAEYIEKNKDAIEKTYIIGGKGVIDTAVESLAVSPERLAGADRYETNVAIMAAFADELNFEKVYVAVGAGKTSRTGYADALSGSALAGKLNAPIVLVYNTIPAETLGFLALATPSNAKVIGLGGSSVVSDKVLDTAAEAITVPVISSNLGTTAKRGTVKEYQVGTRAKGAQGEMVRVKVTVLSGKDVAAIEYKEINDGKYYPLPFNDEGIAWYGPSAGFPLSDATSDFRATFNKVGKIEYKLEVVKVSDNTVLASYASSIEVTAQNLAGDEAKAYVLPTNFNTHLSGDYAGYNVGWKLTDAIALEDVEKMEVSLLDAEGKVLVTNVSTDKIFELPADTKEFSTPFNVNKNIDYTDEYWTFGEWANGTEEPVKAQIVITNVNGDIYTVVDDSLAKVAGHEDLVKYLDTYEPEALEGEEALGYVVPINFNTHFNPNNSLDYVGYNAGWKLTDALTLAKVAKMEVSLLDEEDNVLVTNVSTDKIFELSADTKEFSTPFNVNFHINYTDEYWTFGKWNGKTQQPSKVQIKITTVYGDTYTVVNDSLAVVAGHEAIEGYLGE